MYSVLQAGLEGYTPPPRPPRPPTGIEITAVEEISLLSFSFSFSFSTQNGRH